MYLCGVNDSLIKNLEPMNKKFTLFLMCALCALVGNAAGSGIFVRGGVTNWNADPAWEFQTTEKEGVYILPFGTGFPVSVRLLPAH